MSTFCTDDIGVRQYVMINGRYQLNDFNTAKFMQWNEKEQELCPDVSPKFVEKNRSPEEMRDKVNLVDEKIDVYALGNIFYKLITNEVRTKLTCIDFLYEKVDVVHIFPIRLFSSISLLKKKEKI